jgi:two-component system response regulator YesN
MVKSIRLKTLEFVLWAEHVAYSNGAKGQYRFSDRQDYFDICYSSDMDTLRKWFDDRITDASRCVITKTTTQADNLIDKAREYIGAEYMNDISLDDVSRQINISSYYFSKLFKEETGVNFIEYLTDLRMEKSKELLASPDMSVKDICVSVGYQDPNYFSRIFKKINGVTPTEYREQITVTT